MQALALKRRAVDSDGAYGKRAGAIATAALCESEVVCCTLVYPVVNGLL